MWYNTRSRRPSRRIAVSSRVRLCLESLEERDLPSASFPGPYVYTESNNPAAGQNAVLAFNQNSDGSLTQIGSFNTGGTGLSNPSLLIGPDDSSQELLIDGHHLFAVNQGSNTVSAFRIEGGGVLELTGVFSSGGVQPDSLVVSGDYLYVSNRGDSTFDGKTGVASTVAPNITGFHIGGGGALKPIPGATVTFATDTSPSQNLVTPNGRFLIADIFAVPAIPGPRSAQGNTLDSFRIGPGGQLVAVNYVGAPVPAGVPALLIGAAFNPDQPIIYAGVAKANDVAVFTYDPKSGQLTYSSESPLALGGQTPCWAAVSADGRFLYTGDNGTDSVGVFSLANPKNPVEIQELYLDGGSAPAGASAESKVFQIQLSLDGHTLFVVTQSQNGTYANELHALSVDTTTGELTELNSSPTVLSTGDGVQPQGIVTIASHGHGRADGRDFDSLFEGHFKEPL
jgi:6-phosphogluconolactonase (cycloisomerase 2 family)